jgi:hypothetical protein
MPRPIEINGKKDLRIRVSTQFYEFLKEVARQSGLTISEVCRSALEVWFMVMYMGKALDLKKEYEEYIKANSRLGKNVKKS